MLQTILQRINHWWRSGVVNKIYLPTSIRSELQDVLSSAHKRRILAIIGPRRTGKSTLIMQTIDHLLKSGVDSKRILLFGGDEQRLFVDKADIFTIVEAYLREIVGESVETLSARVYIFIDEIHFCADWQIILKNYYDKLYDIKFVVSGSSSAHLFDNARESLLGRIEYLHVLPLSFSQFVQFNNSYRGENTAILFKETKHSMITNPADFYEEIRKDYYGAVIDNSYQRLLKEYLVGGGYPEYFCHDNLLIWQKQLREDIIMQGLYRDVVSVFGVKNPEILERLLGFVADNQGQAFSFSSLAQTIGVETATASSYIDYLDKAFLLTALENYSGNFGKTLRKNKKLFVLDNGIRNALLSQSEIDPATEGALAESCVVQDLCKFARVNIGSVFYWRDNKIEVDAILKFTNNIIPIEVKYRNNIDKKSSAGIRAFAAKFDCGHGIVVSKNLLALEEDILTVPLWVFALAVSSD